MRATVIHGPGDVRLEDRPDPTIQSLGDAVVQVVRTCVCGSDLWPYRGIQQTTAPHPIGHEFTGVVEATGAEVSTVQVGDFVIAPFTDSGGIRRAGHWPSRRPVRRRPRGRHGGDRRGRRGRAVRGAGLQTAGRRAGHRDVPS